MKVGEKDHNLLVLAFVTIDVNGNCLSYYSCLPCRMPRKRHIEVLVLSLFLTKVRQSEWHCGIMRFSGIRLEFPHSTYMIDYAIPCVLETILVQFLMNS